LSGIWRNLIIGRRLFYSSIYFIRGAVFNRILFGLNPSSQVRSLKNSKKQNFTHLIIRTGEDSKALRGIVCLFLRPELSWDLGGVYKMYQNNRIQTT
jgi:hypothetical protein